MSDIAHIILYSFASGITVLIGGLLARLKLVPDSPVGREISHGVIAFGGGVLVAAVAFVLAPKGIEHLSLPVLIGVFLLGVVSFLFFDMYIARRGGRAAQLTAMMMDFIPEAIALGAIFSTDRKTGLLLALFIGLQNLPEAYNSFGDLRRSGFSPNKALLVLVPFSLVGILAALAGHAFLSGHPQLVAGLMVFAAGAILYLVFQDIAPMVKMRNHWTPATGAALGFLLGMIGEKVLSSVV
ncbi:MAG: divalent cation transporter [Dehalococcoidia bacterium]|jgi:ZIP family zinc transporter